MAHRSQFYGKPINPPDMPKRTYKNSTQEERDFAIELDKQFPGEYAAIARRVVREFGVQRGATAVKNWIVASKK